MKPVYKKMLAFCLVFIGGFLAVGNAFALPQQVSMPISETGIVSIPASVKNLNWLYDSGIGILTGCRIHIYTGQITSTSTPSVLNFCQQELTATDEEYDIEFAFTPPMADGYYTFMVGTTAVSGSNFVDEDYAWAEYYLSGGVWSAFVGPINQDWIGNLVPEFGTTTQSKVVTYGFDYHISPGSEYVNYTLGFADEDQVETSTTTPQTGVLTGSGTFSSSGNFISGHVYTMTVTLCNSDLVPQCLPFKWTKFVVETGSIIQNTGSTICNTGNVLIDYPCIAIALITSALFKPSPTTLERFTDRWSQLGQKAPFGWVGSIVDEFEGFSTTTATSTPFSFATTLSDSSPVFGFIIDSFKVLIGSIFWVMAIWIGVRSISAFI